MQEKIDEIIAGGGKIFLWIFSGLMGIIGKFSMDALRRKQFTWWQAFGELGVAIFIGWLAGVYCYKTKTDNAPFIISMATYLSSKLATIAFNWKEVRKYIIELLQKM